MPNESVALHTQFAEIREIISTYQGRALQEVNREDLLCRWTVGRYVSFRLNTLEWGSQVVTQLSEFLTSGEGGLRGYSRRNLYNMVAFYEAYSSESFRAVWQKYARAMRVQTPSAQIASMPTTEPSAIVQMASAQISPTEPDDSREMPKVLELTTFSNHLEIINGCREAEAKLFYILYAHRERLNNRELKRCLAIDTYGNLANSRKPMSEALKTTYPLSPQMLKDRVYLDFLDLPELHNEKQLHGGILDKMKQFILELGKDFLFVDSEFPVQVGASTYKIDLLFFHRALQCLVAVELKATSFMPEYIGKLEFYLEALDRDVKRSNENPSIGILLCRNADRSVVEYALSRSLSPTMVAEYRRQLLPKEAVQRSLDEFVDFFSDNITARGSERDN